MALKAQYEAMDEIPEAFRELYEEKDGRAVLTGIEGVASADELTAKERALQNARRVEREMKGKWEPWAPVLGDRKPEDLQATLDEIEELRAKADSNGSADVEERANKIAEARLASVKTPLERQLKAEQTRRQNLETDLAKLRDERVGERIDNVIRDAATKAGVRPEAIEDARALRAVFEVLEDGQVVTKPDNGFQPGMTADLVFEEIKKSRPHWWPTSQGAGAEANRGGGTTRTGMLTPEQAEGLSLADYKKARAEGRIR